MILRTFHPDEANQAFTTGKLLETGTYAYDPADHHGPTLYYAAAALQKAGGVHGTADLNPHLLRATPALFAVCALLLGALALRKALVRRTHAATVLATAVFPLLLAATPIFLFFSTFFIQEMLLACFSVGCFAAVVFYRTSDSPKRGRHLFFLGLCTGLAFATKETAILTLGAAVLALFGAKRLAPIPRTDTTTLRKPPSQNRTAPPHTLLLLPLLVALLTAITLFSSFGTRTQGLYDAFVTAPKAYLLHAFGLEETTLSGAHNHPGWWYLRLLLLPSENLSFSLFVPTLTVLVGSFRYLRRNRLFAFLSLHALLLLGLYSLFPYKTPWCMLQVAVPLVAAFGLLLALLAEDDTLPSVVRRPLPWFLAAAAFLSFLPADIQTIRDPDSKAIPYNYAAASPQMKELAADLRCALTRVSSTPSGYGAVLLPAEDTWPLPFYLKDCPHVGYWHDPEADLRRLAALPAGKRPCALVTPAEIGHLVFPLFPELKHTRRYEMRPGIRVRLFR